MNKIFGNDSNALFEDDMHINEAFDEVFKQIYEQENEISYDKLIELWAEVEQSEKMIMNETNLLFENEGLQISIESEMKKLKDAESSLDALKKHHLELVRQHKEKQKEVLSSLDHVEGLIHVADTKMENEQKTLNVILIRYENELRELKNKILAKKRNLFSE